MIDRTGQVWIFDVGGDERELIFVQPPSQHPMWVGVQFQHKAIMRYAKDPAIIIQIDWSEPFDAPFERNPTYARVL